MPPKAPSSPPSGIEGGGGGGRKKLSFLRRTTSKRSIRTRSARFLNPLKTAQAARDSVLANAEARHDPLFLDDPFAASVEEFEEMKAAVTNSEEVLGGGGGGGGGSQLVSSMSERILIRGGPRRDSRKLQNNYKPPSGGGGGGPHQPAASTSDGHPAPRRSSGIEMIGAFAVDGADPGYNTHQRDGHQSGAGGSNNDSGSGQGANPTGEGLQQQKPEVATAGDAPRQSEPPSQEVQQQQQQPTANSAGGTKEPSTQADRASSDPSAAAATRPAATTSSTDDGIGACSGPAEEAPGSPVFNNEGIAASTTTTPGDSSARRGRSEASATSKEPGGGPDGALQRATAATETSAGPQHENGTSSESSHSSALPSSSKGGGQQQQQRGALRRTSSPSAQHRRSLNQTERRPRKSILAAVSSTARLSLADEELPATSLSPPRANSRGVSGSGNNNNARPTLASECLSPSRSLRSQRLAARGAGYLTATSSQSLATSSAFVQASCQWNSETIAENDGDGKAVRQDPERRQQGQGQQSPLPPLPVNKGSGGVLGGVEEQKDKANKTVGTPVLDVSDNVVATRDDKTTQEEPGSLGWREWLERKYRKKEEKQQQQQKVGATNTEAAATIDNAGEGKDIHVAPKETHERADNRSNIDSWQPPQDPPSADADPPAGVERTSLRERASDAAVAKVEVRNKGRTPTVSDSSDKKNDDVNAKENKLNGLSTMDDFHLPVEKHGDGIDQKTTKKTNRTKDRRKQFATAARCASESSMQFVSVRCKDGKVWDLSNLCKSPDLPAAAATGSDDCKVDVDAGGAPTSKVREKKSVKQSTGRAGKIPEDAIGEEERDEDEAINAALASFAAFPHPTENPTAIPQRRHTLASARGRQRPPRGGQQRPETVQRRATDSSAAVDFSNLYPQITKVTDEDGVPSSRSSDDPPARQTEQQRKESAKVVVDEIFKMTKSRNLSNESVGNETFDECDKKQAHRPLHDDGGNLSKGLWPSLKDDQADDSSNGGTTTETVYVATCGHTTTVTTINNTKAATRIDNSKAAAAATAATTSLMHPPEGETWMSQAEQRRMQNLRDLHAVQALLRGEDLDHYNDGPPPAPSSASVSPAREAGEKVYASTLGSRGVEVQSALPDEASMKTMWMSSGIDANPARGPVAPLPTEAPRRGSAFSSSSPTIHERRGGGGYDNGASQLRSMLEEQRNIWGESSSNLTTSTTHTRSEAVSLVGRTPNRRGHSVTFSDTASVAASAAVASHGGRGTADEGHDDRSRRFPLGTQLSLSSFETEENNDVDDANSVCSDGYERRIVEISPGQFMCLRGSAETWDAIQKGEAGTVKCIMCDSELKCVRDAELVICPDCRVLSPVPPDTPAMRDGSTAHDQFGMRGSMVDSSDSTELRRPRGRATHMNILGRIGGVGLGVKMNEMMRRDSGR